MEKIYQSGFANPFLPLSIYIPDGEPKVFDGRIYLYGSKDYMGGEYCCHKYHTYSASVDNLEEWTDHGPSIASTDEYADEGIRDGVPWSDALLYAPDVIKRGDKYYLYFCLSDGSEGVAESPYPYGPFTNAKQVMMDGKPITGIDPSVLYDNGEYYYTWGQGHCHMAKLKDDMCTLDADTYAEAIVSHDDGMHGFHEGSSIRKIGNWYCMVYASEYTEEFPNRGGRPTKLDYAVSKDIYGPYERRGTIIDNTGIDPVSWNNHGSIVKIKDQWYVFYHGSSNHSQYTRRARVERIEVDEENGWIRQADMTSSGFAETLDVSKKIEAAYAYRVTNGAYLTEKGETYPLVSVKNGCSASYRYLNLESKPEWKISLTVKPLAGGKVCVLVNGEKKAEFVIECGTSKQVVSGVFSCVNKKVDLTILFESDHEDEIAEMESFVLS